MRLLETPYPSRQSDGCQFYDLREFSAMVDLRHRSDSLIVCFANAPMTRHSTDPNAYWSARFMEIRQLDHVCISGRVETWFRSDIVSGFLQALSRSLSYDRILTYGISKGGTAALWHAGAARATDVFACVPQVFPDHRALARGDDRWHSAAYHTWPDAELADSLAEVARLTVLTDRCNEFEAAYLDDLCRVSAHPPRIVDMRYAGHDAASMLGRQHALSRLFDLVVSDRMDPQRLRHLTERRKAEAGYYRNLLANRRVAKSELLSRIVKGSAAVRSIDPASVRTDSGYRKLGKMGRY